MVNGKMQDKDPRDGVPSDVVPIDHTIKSKENDGVSVRKKIKQVMRS